MAKRIFSLCVCFILIASCLMVPVKAIDIPIVGVAGFDVVDLFDYVLHNIGYQTLNALGGIFNKDICQGSPNLDGLHNFVERHTQVDGQIGNYYICEYCGKSAGEVGEEAYTEQVSTLPATEYGSDGSVYVVPATFQLIRDDNRSSLSNRIPNGGTFSLSDSSFSAFLPILRFDILRKYTLLQSPASFSVNVEYPIPFLCSAQLLFSSATFESNLSSGQLIYSGSGTNFSAGSTFRAAFSTSYFPIIVENNYAIAGNYVIFHLNDLRIKLTPFTSLSDTTYNTTTRPTSITGGNYGIVGDNGQITTVVDNSSIVNEINNTYYNPATGQTETINSWTYDYSDRSYHITLDSGDNITVTYGNENITIMEGDTTYNVYYIINSEGSGSGSGGGSGDDTPSHTHNWQETSRKEPTCTAPGQILYTCSECNQTQTETLKATGHTWQLDHTVQNSYDSDGNLIQQGYTLYVCSSCGQQYTDSTGAGPPSGSGGSSDDGESIWEKIGNLIGGIFGAIVDFISGILGKILDVLASLGELIIGKLSSVVGVVFSIFDQVPSLFGGFLDFLSVIFPFFPPEITLVLTFGIVALVFVGIIKAIRR